VKRPSGLIKKCRKVQALLDEIKVEIVSWERISIIDLNCYVVKKLAGQKWYHLVGS
jgi:hypothetical protein